jgi:hypothetical protein
VDTQQVESFSGETAWMMLSPYWLAKAHYDTARRHTGVPPHLNALGQMLIDAYNLAIPPGMLKRWMNEFYYIS